MNTKSYLGLAVWAAMITTSAMAGPGNVSNYPTRIDTREEAEKLDKSTPMAFACTSCKTVQPVAEKKTFLSWFAPDQTHECPGCGGKVSTRPVPGGKPQSITVFAHVCSKCGEKSAYTCAGHKS